MKTDDIDVCVYITVHKILSKKHRAYNTRYDLILYL